MKDEVILKFKPYRNLTCWTFLQENDFEYVKMFTPRGIINLNKIGSLVWKLLDEVANVNELIQKFSTLFPNINPSVLKNDIVNFLMQLEKDEIIILNWNPLQPYYIAKSKRRC
jgi:hypothetical protein